MMRVGRKGVHKGDSIAADLLEWSECGGGKGRRGRTMLVIVAIAADAAMLVLVALVLVAACAEELKCIEQD
jgi:hypothetical protein